VNEGSLRERVRRSSLVELAGLSALEAQYGHVNSDAQFVRARRKRVILRTDMRTGSSVAGAGSYLT
jgi:hypothetical protein